MCGCAETGNSSSLPNKNPCDFAAGAKKQNSNSSTGKTGDLGDFAVRISLSISKPEDLAIAGAHLRKRRAKKSFVVGLRGVIGLGEELGG